MLAVKTQDLRRVYESQSSKSAVAALDGVSLSVPVGEVHGLLGPNGAGKTTLTKILATALLPSSGAAFVMGFDVAKNVADVRRSIGLVLGGERGLYTYLTVEENLNYWGALYGMEPRRLRSRVPALLDRLGLAQRARSRIHELSRGMKQRVHLARGLVADPALLLLDEPTIGMDPIAAKEFRVLIRQLKAEGKTILLTTHDMEEAEDVCDRVALIDSGRVLTTETPEQLKQLATRHERVDFAGGDESIAARIRAIPGVGSVVGLQRSNEFRVELSQATASREVLALLLSLSITSIRTSRPSLAEVYVQLIGDRGLRV